MSNETPRSAPVCPGCGEEQAQSLAHHWKVAECTPPTISPTTKLQIVGALLGGAHLRANASGNYFIERNFKSQQAANWLKQTLGPLGRYGSIYETPSGSSRLRTITHPRLIEFTNVYAVEDNKRLLPETLAKADYDWTAHSNWQAPTGAAYELAPTSARIWYALKGSLRDQGAIPVPSIPKHTFEAPDSAWTSLFDSFSPTAYDERIQLNAAMDWFDYIGWTPALPGVDHWATKDELTDGTKCPDCGRFFKRIKSHWAQSACSEPSESE